MRACDSSLLRRSNRSESASRLRFIACIHCACRAMLLSMAASCLLWSMVRSLTASRTASFTSRRRLAIISSFCRSHMASCPSRWLASDSLIASMSLVKLPKYRPAMNAPTTTPPANCRRLGSHSNMPPITGSALGFQPCFDGVQDGQQTARALRDQLKLVRLDLDTGDCADGDDGFCDFCPHGGVQHGATPSLKKSHPRTLPVEAGGGGGGGVWCRG